MDGRTSDGRFAKGNPGGPGRPSRPIEQQYLAAVTDACQPEVWLQICRRAVQDALDGDRAAREWLARILLGRNPPDLLDIAADAASGQTADDLVQRRIESREEQSVFDILAGLSPVNSDDADDEDDFDDLLASVQ